MLSALHEIFSAKRVRTDQDALSHWGRDWTRSVVPSPAAVVFPESADEVVRLVRLANDRQLKLVPSGGRTGLSGGAVAASSEIVVSFDRMNRILDFNDDDRLVRCQPGVVTAALQQFAAAQDLFYPVDFASAGSSQIGGNIATNAGGIRVIRYGTTRAWVAGLKVVTGTGALIDCNRGLMKNATGYDLRHLMIGSEGTLGLIVEAEIRLCQAPEPQRVMVLGVERFVDLLQVLKRFQRDMALSAFEFFSDKALAKVLAHRDLRPPLRDAAAFYALVEFDEEASERAMSAFEDCTAGGLVTDAVLSQNDAQLRALWQLREGISESLAGYTPYKNDLAVKIAELPSFLAAIDAAVAASFPDFEVCWYGHIGDGNLHLNILRPEHLSLEEFNLRCHAINPRILDVVTRHEGSISAEHGVGLLKRDFLSYSRSPHEIMLMAGIKRAFDPNGVLNPGKLLLEPDSRSAR
jgi:FAD/FMN-containing dehydrogenase